MAPMIPVVALAPHDQEPAAELNLPVGLRFRPTDEEVIGIYLLNEATGGDSIIPGFKIPELDVYATVPWMLRPRPNGKFSVAGEFYCFVRLKRSTAKDNRLKRQTPYGFWKASSVRHQVPVLNTRKPCIGHRMHLKFHWYGDGNVSSGLPRGKRPAAEGTVWVMHEYRLPASFWEMAPPDVGELVMCRISPTGSGLDIGKAWERPPLAFLLNDGANEGPPRDQNGNDRAGEGPPRDQNGNDGADEGPPRDQNGNDGALVVAGGGGDAPPVVNFYWTTTALTTPTMEESSAMGEAWGVAGPANYLDAGDWALIDEFGLWDGPLYYGNPF